MYYFSGGRGEIFFKMYIEENLSDLKANLLSCPFVCPPYNLVPSFLVPAQAVSLSDDWETPLHPELYLFVF